MPVNVLSRKDYPNFYATILWDNAFALPNREMFETKKSVTWPELAFLLDKKFYKDVGINLKSNELNFIYTMIPNLDPNNNEAKISWEQFAKIKLSEREFTFFEWFYRILVLVREKLIKLYSNKLIHGFVSSDESEILLKNCIDGTFLIRFSETYCGAISISYKRNGNFTKTLPWDLEHLKKISLSNTIKLSHNFLFLYPDIPKDNVFEIDLNISNNRTKSITKNGYDGTLNTSNQFHE